MVGLVETKAACTRHGGGIRDWRRRWRRQVVEECWSWVANTICVDRRKCRGTVASLT